MQSRVFVNRTLNLKRIKAIGLDMDHTLIRYNIHEFEKLSHTLVKHKLKNQKNYPDLVEDLPFDDGLTIRGLVVDRKKGNLLKLNRHSAIRVSSHGSQPIDYKTQQKMYQSTYIDLGDSNYLTFDTAFSISLATLIVQIIDLKRTCPELSFPDFSVIVDDVLNMVDEAHRDGSLKENVRSNLGKYILKDPELVAGLEKFKRHGKRIFIVTNSDFHYTKALLDEAIQPFLKEHKSWKDLFEVVITSAQKPRFFWDDLKFLKINPLDGTMTNLPDRLKPGIYQGGSAKTFTQDLDLQGDEILYIGDHIYGDILRLKKDCGWRTAMVIEELEEELKSNQKAEPINQEIETLMIKKEPLEEELTELMTQRVEARSSEADKRAEVLQQQISDIDGVISQHIRQQNGLYNPKWGSLMRVGNEESFFAYQVDRYACVYMSKLADLFELSPRTYFRAPRKLLSHEMIKS